MMDREADYFPEAEQMMPHAMAFTRLMIAHGIRRELAAGVIFGKSLPFWTTKSSSEQRNI